MKDMVALWEMNVEIVNRVEGGLLAMIRVKPTWVEQAIEAQK